ncbi:SMI1/KNR4 family protein [Piscinibacter gummiphilus]|uniref:SMI1 / KNR4 family protein n=1 Tax=Piscinibacter gummiphilus TaxID=946333 RepID=A0A1W6L514_9BURK|nr:SMI1/KNR4 family protein [Piscinibacter gummiphilus]ARN19286.1 SMI1 / KNR4 family protein [Piscinibacter gummiphilus]ATU63951.1 SMI1/KNR4 family protein [Piscinibacter gummiphilus]GLS93096.1 hypothetical protein GCM10007918_03870 [Piscinibacter gummiphilus]
MRPFGNFDLTAFWEASEYADEEYVEPPPTAATLAAVEADLGYKLPAAYVALAAVQNGGIPVNTAHRTSEPTSWASDHIAITGIYAIGRDRPNSLCGEFGSEFWHEEWGYPEIGVYFADCPSAGHDMLCLDYRACGPAGEPTVVHVDQELGYKVTFVAADFESFIRSLTSDEDFVD